MAGKQRILVLSVGAGSGHLRAGEALELAARENPEVGEVLHVDALKLTTKLFKDWYGGSYMALVRKAPTVWGWFYNYSDEPWSTHGLRLALSRPNAGRLVRFVRDFAPDVVLCTHFMPSEVISHLIGRRKLSVKLGMVVTDYHVHAMWLAKTFHHYFVPCEEAKVHMTMLGYPEDRIAVTGIPIHPSFAAASDRDKLRKSHKVDPSKPVILVSAGAFGVTDASDIVESLSYIKTPAQIVVICGKNAGLKQEVEDYTSSRRGPGPEYRVLGYTNVMHEWMSLADLYIGKPGGLTCSEAMAKGLPMIIFDPIPGQEDANSDYLLEKGVALKCRDASLLPYKTDMLLGDAARLRAMRAAALECARPDAARTVIDAAMAMDESPEFMLPFEDQAFARPDHWARPLDRDGVPNLFQVDNTIYRGGQPTAEGFRTLEEMGIRTVVNLRSFHSDSRLLKNTGIREERLPVRLLNIMEDDLEEFCRIASRSGNGPFYVHCRQGIERTGIACAAYRVAMCGWSEDDAIDEMVNGGFGYHPLWAVLAGRMHAFAAARRALARSADAARPPLNGTERGQAPATGGMRPQ
ncbi:MAG: glycosyltransferase [Lentisphaerae bacterium]|nr:glycosyltransferase [Lentisphaerota bacterium]